MRERTGLAKGEIVAAAIIALLMLALLIPFLLRQRGAARSLTCQDRLARLAQAAHRFEEQSLVLPGYRQRSEGGGLVLGWVATLMPHLTTASLDGSESLLQMHAALLAQRGEPGRVPELLCPAQARFARSAPLSFVANCGMPDSDNPQFPPDWPSNGLFFDYDVSPSRRVSTSLDWLSRRDGAAATLLLAENVDAGGWSDAGEAQVGFVWAANWKEGEPSPLPTVWPLNEARGMGDGTVKFARPASEHIGGANVAFANGTTQLLSERIDYLVYQRLMTADGAQVKAAGSDEWLPPPWRHGVRGARSDDDAKSDHTFTEEDSTSSS